MENKKFAVLIDADNISRTKIRYILDEIARWGSPVIKRAYGDWTSPSMSAWKSVLLDNSVIPVQQYAYTTGKNATDSALIIDAMDILHRENVDGFCIVSSDSDFTRLSSRIRESGREVLGFGERKTPAPFVKSCDRFVFVEILGQNEEPATAPASPIKKEEKKPPVSAGGVVSANDVPAAGQRKEKSLLPIDEAFKSLLVSTVNDVADEDGWAFLGVVGNVLVKKMPEFDPRNYGFPKLTPLIRSLFDLFEVEERPFGEHNLKHIYVRNR